MESPSKRLSVVLVTAWLAVVSCGLGLLWRYAKTPGAQEAHPTEWPRESRIARRPGRATLLLFAHARCPCTRASLGQLNVILARTVGRLETHVVLYRPGGFSGAGPDLGPLAAALPGVFVLEDPARTEAWRFGALTSGQALLYDTGGRLVFAGGITPSRGHAGDNDGQSSIVSIVNGGQAVRTETTVFGCSIGGHGAS